MSTISRRPLAEQAADAIHARIRAEEWTLGEKLPSEVSLAPQIGVGRSTVREAIRQLAARGIVQSRQGSGVFVMSREAVDDPDSALHRADIATVIEARIAVEVEAASLAAAHRTPAQLRALRRLLDARSATTPAVAADRVPQLVDADVRFHRAIVAASDNEILLELFDAFSARMRHAMIQMLIARPMSDPAADQALHAGIVDRIASRDSEAAATLLRTHLTSMKEPFA